jgi:hypothetical protein
MLGFSIGDNAPQVNGGVFWLRLFCGVFYIKLFRWAILFLLAEGVHESLADFS